MSFDRNHELLPPRSRTQPPQFWLTPPPMAGLTGPALSQTHREPFQRRKPKWRWQPMLLLGWACLAHVPPVLAVHFYDDFSDGLSAWAAGPPWEIKTSTPGVTALSVDTQDDVYAWKTNAVLDTSWTIDADVDFKALHADSGRDGAASLALAAGHGAQLRILATVEHNASGAAFIDLQYLNTKWHPLLEGKWHQGVIPFYHLRLEFLPGSGRLRYTVTCTNGFSFVGDSSLVPASITGDLDTPGLRCLRAQVDFANLDIQTPATLSSDVNQHHRELAVAAVNDLLNHFWVGSPSGGQIVNTWTGYTNALPDPRGVLWERATFYSVLRNLYTLTGDLGLQQRLQSDWQRTKTVFRPDELVVCGGDSGINWCVDDAGWSALLYLAAFEVTRDRDALTAAEGLVANAYRRWYDESFGGGLWYQDAHQFKSLYQCAVTLAALRIYEHTGDKSFLDQALRSYTWMERHLARADGLYWCDYNAGGPIGTQRSEATFFGGNMAMGVLHARLYRLTSEDEYRKRAIRVAEGLLQKLVDPSGAYRNERDAWANGFFVGEWAREVLPLPGITARHWSVLRKTADTIATQARTAEGYYGGCWSGPADGSGCFWSVAGSKPQQITVSANSANMIVAAAFLESPYPNQLRPLLSVVRHNADATLRVESEPGLACVIESSNDLSRWTPISMFVGDGTPHEISAVTAPTGAVDYFRAGVLPTEW